MRTLCQLPTPTHGCHRKDDQGSCLESPRHAQKTARNQDLAARVSRNKVDRQSSEINSHGATTNDNAYVVMASIGHSHISLSETRETPSYMFPRLPRGSERPLSTAMHRRCPIMARRPRKRPRVAPPAARATPLSTSVAFRSIVKRNTSTTGTSNSKGLRHKTASCDDV